MVTKDGLPADLLPGGAGSPLLRAWFEAAHLKQLFRQGWLKRGVAPERCESVAEHTFGVALLCLLLLDSRDDGLDREKVLRLALVHDLGEIHAGDITPVDGVPADEKSRREREAVRRTLGGLPGGDGHLAAWEEYEAGATPEARFVRQVDRLEMGLQAGIYEHQGLLDPEEFLGSADRALEDPQLRDLFAELLRLRPGRGD